MLYPVAILPQGQGCNKPHRVGPAGPNKQRPGGGIAHAEPNRIESASLLSLRPLVVLEAGVSDNFRDLPLPHDPEAERAVLSAMLLDATAAAKGAATGAPELFFEPRHQVLFGAMCRLVRDGRKVDPIMVRDALGPIDLDRIGGIEYVATLIDVVPTAAHVEDHIGILADKAHRRQLVLAAHRLIEDIGRKPLAELTADASSMLKAAAPKSTGATRCRTLAELLADPETQAPPLVVVPRLAWKGRVTLLAAREKDGKSTLAAAGVAAVTQGRQFLNEPTTASRVLWLAAEEHPNDLAQRAQLFGTHEQHLHVVGRPSPDSLFADIRADVETVKPALLVVDTLASAVEGLVDDPHSSTAWTPVMSALTAIARDCDVAILLLAHARKSDGSYRDSTAIGAGVDVILEMSTPVDDATARTIKARGRWAMHPFTVRFTGGRFDLTGGELSLDARALLHIEKEPGISKQRLRDVVGGRAESVDDAVTGLERRGAVVIRPGPRGAKLLYPAAAAPPELAMSQDVNPDEVRDEVVTPSRDPVPILSRNDLAPDEVARSSRSKTHRGETGRGETRCPEGHALIGGLCPECDRARFLAAIDAEAAAMKGAAA